MVSRGVLAVGHEDGGVVLHVPSRREAGRVLGDTAHPGRAHSGRVLSVAMSADGRTVASASADRSWKLWDVASGVERLCVKGHDSLGECVCQRRCPVFGSVEPDASCSVKGHISPVNAIALCGEMVATGGGDGVILWDQSGEVRWEGEEGKMEWVWALAFSPNCKHLAVGDAHGCVSVLGVGNGATIRVIQPVQASRIYTVCYSPDGLRLAFGGSGGEVKVWDTGTWEELRVLPGHTTAAVRAVAFRPDGRFLASGSMDNAVSVWDHAEGKALPTLATGSPHPPWGPPPPAGVRAVVFSPDGRTLASGHADGTLTVWDGRTTLTTFGARHYVHDFGAQVLALAFGRDCVRDERNH